MNILRIFFAFGVCSVVCIVHCAKLSVTEVFAEISPKDTKLDKAQPIKDNTPLIQSEIIEKVNSNKLSTPLLTRKAELSTPANNRPQQNQLSTIARFTRNIDRSNLNRRPNDLSLNSTKSQSKFKFLIPVS